MEGRRVLITGPTGQVGLPVALALAERNEVIGVARFGDAGARERLESASVTCISADLVAGDLARVPTAVDHVANFAVAKTGDFDRDLAANVESLGLLMHHCREATSFLHCSSTAVYQPNGHHDFAETDPLGDNHRPFGFLPTYSIAKIAAVIFACWRANSASLSAPRQSAVPLGPQSPELLLDVTSTVENRFKTLNDAALMLPPTSSGEAGAGFAGSNE